MNLIIAMDVCRLLPLCATTIIIHNEQTTLYIMEQNELNLSFAIFQMAEAKYITSGRKDQLQAFAH